MMNATKAAAETLLGESERSISLFLDFELYISQINGIHRMQINEDIKCVLFAPNVWKLR
jgi:hypothetical protein